ncbi:MULTISPECIES: rhodanese-like domain-containing protein [Campylobacter]|uniref:rhodanese-like domain-containing protein n=1 Tax=Campylobacter TaxID=194 RepID=UPI00027A3910|nr:MULTISPECIES: rhodanese-like domain-containing protein [Campylobacter]EJP75239.1 rhodanese-like protein [Campylobacter sp. FOBRC14]
MNKISKFTLCLVLCVSAAFAKIETLEASPQNVEKFEQIVDVRTPSEWQETGVIKGAKLVTLVNDKGEFLAKLKDSGVDLSKPVAFICRSGRRSLAAANLADSADANITNLDGGMSGLISKGYKAEPYSGK